MAGLEGEDVPGGVAGYTAGAAGIAVFFSILVDLRFTYTAPDSGRPFRAHGGLKHTATPTRRHATNRVPAKPVKF